MATGGFSRGFNFADLAKIRENLENLSRKQFLSLRYFHPYNWYCVPYRILLIQSNNVSLYFLIARGAFWKRYSGDISKERHWDWTYLKVDQCLRMKTFLCEDYFQLGFFCLFSKMHCYWFFSYTFPEFHFETVGISKVYGTIILLAMPCLIFDAVIKTPSCM